MVAQLLSSLDQYPTLFYADNNPNTRNFIGEAISNALKRVEKSYIIRSFPDALGLVDSVRDYQGNTRLIITGCNFHGMNGIEAISYLSQLTVSRNQKPLVVLMSETDWYPLNGKRIDLGAIAKQYGAEFILKPKTNDQYAIALEGVVQKAFQTP